MSDWIAATSRVTLHFSLALPDGQMIDSTYERSPATFRMGDGSLLPGFEQKLLGLRPGDKQDFEVLPEQAFGQPNAANVQQFPRHRFGVDQPVEAGLVVSFADAGGNELPGVVTAVAGDTVTVDFNHPLAGRTMVFRVDIIAVDNDSPLTEVTS